MLECSLYDDIRSELMDKAISIVPEFQGLHSGDKMSTLCVTNKKLYPNVLLILKRRKF